MAQCSVRPKFAERDRLWEAGDPAYLALSDALQYLGPSHLRSRGKLVLEQNEFLAPSLANGVRHGLADSDRAVYYPPYPIAVVARDSARQRTPGSAPRPPLWSGRAARSPIADTKSALQCEKSCAKPSFFYKT